MALSRVRFFLQVLSCSPKPMPETLAEVKGAWGELDLCIGRWRCSWETGREEGSLLLWYPLFPTSKHHCAITTDVENLPGRREANHQEE